MIYNSPQEGEKHPFWRVIIFIVRHILLFLCGFGEIQIQLYMKIVGRREEIALLNDLLKRNHPEFVAVYGRRRVGKTFLVREVYKEQIVFECSGLHQKSLAQQLENFWLTLQESNPGGPPSLPPRTWLQAFSQLKIYLNSITNEGKKVVFLDEIPWFETPKSGFLAALDNFWNQYCSKREDIILVICGSAASWIIKKVINNRGGLHNRITTHIRLMPFTLNETKEFLELNQVHLTFKDIAQLYMSVGGVPFYLKDVKPGKSIPQILDDLFFHNQATLQNEFNNLYAALFKNSEVHEAIVAALASKNKGLTRAEIIEQTKLNTGGGLSLALKELIECGFIKQIHPFQNTRENGIYRLIDEYSHFYFKFLNQKGITSSWQQISEKPAFKIWSGYAFENLCLKHTRQIKQALGIHGIITNEFSWSQAGNKNKAGAQIDLIIDRADNCINIFEMKFHHSSFTITNQYAEQIQRKIDVFSEQTQTKKNIFLIFLTAYGVEKNKYYLSLQANQLRLEDLFLPTYRLP
ncbi:MAG: ATP-binding protein [Bacteroidia bacterium]